MRNLTPREIVKELNQHIVGQDEAKRAVAIAVRNRWRRQQLPEDMRTEVPPKNILMIGPTGVGKTEIARRFSKMTEAPFIKIEATKYTEVGYYGRDVESMIRDLVENAIGLVRAQEQERVREEAKAKVEEKILDMIHPWNAPKRGAGKPLRKGKSWSKDFAENALRTARNIHEEKGGTDGESYEEVTRENTLRGMGEVLDHLLGQVEKMTGKTIKRDPELDRRAMEEMLDNSEEDEKPKIGVRCVTISPFGIQASESGDAGDLLKMLKGLQENLGVKDDDGDDDDDDDDDEEDEDVNTEETESDKAAEDAEHAELLRKAREEYDRKREELRQKLRAGELDAETVNLTLEKKAKSPFMMMNIGGGDMMDQGMSEMFDRFLPSKQVKREMTVKEAQKILLEKESDSLINEEKVNTEAVRRAEETGIIFIDEIDKIVASEQSHSADVSRQGVQRDLLPLVEGTTVQTRYGYVKTDHILFIAAGAFHRNKPSDLMPELQGRFPIRVELKGLTQDDFERILLEPKNSLLRQYEALLKTEGVEVEFTPDAVRELAAYAWQANQHSQNIGARRLYTIMERLLEELSFEAADMISAKVTINAGFVKQRLEEVTKNEDLTRYIL